MAKYDPLQRLLERNGSPALTLRFAEIDAVVGGLPAYARSGDLRWWENENESGHHVQAKAWREAGYKVWSVKFDAETVEFQKAENSN